MATITLYTFEDVDGTESTYTESDVDKAQMHARDFDLRVIANEYEWADSQVIFDFTSKPVAGF